MIEICKFIDEETRQDVLMYKIQLVSYSRNHPGSKWHPEYGWSKWIPVKNEVLSHDEFKKLADETS